MSESELEQYRRILQELGNLAEHASLTGSLSGGEKRAIDRYNAVLAELTQRGAVPDGIFQVMPPDANFGELAVDARMLAAHLEGARPSAREGRPSSLLMRLAPFIDSADLAELVREQMQSSEGMNMDMVANLAPFLKRETLGKLVRMNMSRSGAAEPSDKTEPVEGPERPAEPARPDPATHPVATPQADQRPEEVLALLKNPHLTEEERASLVARLELLIQS